MVAPTPKSKRTRRTGRMGRRVVPQEVCDARDIERRERIASIFSAPEDELVPSSIPELLLIALATFYDVRVYASGGECTGTWVVWLQPLADVRTDKDGRVSLAVWRKHWRPLLIEMGYAAEQAAETAEGGTDA